MPDLTPMRPAQTALLVNLIRRAAAAEILPRFRALEAAQITAKSGPQDLVTEADHEAEAMITRALAAAFPDAVIIGEEAAETDTGYRARLVAAPLAFVIDPVDGTWNFAHGLPLFGAMIAVCRFGVPVLGLILDAITGDIAVAGIDAPAQSCPRRGVPHPLRTAAPKPLAGLIGYMEQAFLPEGLRQTLALRACALGHVTTLRCSAHQYRMLAQGAVDFNLAVKLSPWDHLAGSLLVAQAGGHVAMLDGRPYDASCDSGYLLAASGKEVWARLRDHLAEDLL